MKDELMRFLQWIVIKNSPQRTPTNEVFQRGIFIPWHGMLILGIIGIVFGAVFTGYLYSELVLKPNILKREIEDQTFARHAAQERAQALKLILQAKDALQRDDRNLAANLLDTAIQVAPSIGASFRERMELALAEQDTKTALRCAQALIPLIPSVEHYLQLAMLQRIYQGPDDVAATLKAAIAAHPKNRELALQYSAFLYERGAQEEADQLLASIEGSDHIALSLQRDAMRSSWRSDRFPANVSAVEVSTQKTAQKELSTHISPKNTDSLPTDNENLEQAVHTFERQGQFQSAWTRLKVNRPWQTPALYAAAVRVLLQLHQIKEANEALTRALHLYPNNAEIQRTAGTLYGALQHPLQAERAFRTAYRIDPTDVASIRGLIILYLKEGAGRDALLWAERAQAIRPGDANLFHLHLQAIAFTENIDKAKFLYHNFIQAGGKPTAAIYFSMASLLRAAQTDLADAEQYYENCLKLEPTHVPALNELAMLLVNQKRTTDAEELIPLLLKHAGNAPFALDTAAQVYIASGKLGEARTLLKKASEQEPENRVLWKTWALLEEHAGSMDARQKWLDKLARDARTSRQ